MKISPTLYAGTRTIYRIVIKRRLELQRPFLEDWRLDKTGLVDHYIFPIMFGVIDLLLECHLGKIQALPSFSVTLERRSVKMNKIQIFIQFFPCKKITYLAVATPQCGYFIIFLSLRFYVKSNLEKLEGLKMLFLPF